MRPYLEHLYKNSILYLASIYLCVGDIHSCATIWAEVCQLFGFYFPAFTAFSAVCVVCAIRFKHNPPPMLHFRLYCGHRLNTIYEHTAVHSIRCIWCAIVSWTILADLFLKCISINSPHLRSPPF